LNRSIHRFVLGLSLAAAVALTAHPAAAESRSSYNSSVSGFTVTFNGSAVDVSQLFGFKIGSNKLTFNGYGDYKLNSVRKFVLLYDEDPVTGIPNPLNTASAIGNINPKQVWTADSKTSGPGAFYGWETTQGTSKRGQFAPGASGFDTTNVFRLSQTLFGDGSKKLIGFGWDVSIEVASGAVDPFSGKTVNRKGNYTGYVYQRYTRIAVIEVPEPFFYQMGALLGLGAVGLLWRRRRS
jgi:hypothetical protein